jgi:thiamine-monophosphate kinase
VGEFELIERYFARSATSCPDVILGIGDDCALLSGDARDWAVSTDTLIEGVHFLADVDPAALGHKALAVNLSDLAACGADPRCFLLALALPRVDENWLAGFADGLFELARQHGCELAGGDTTRSAGGVAITITAFGRVETGRALLRSGARPGDELWVSGSLGDAALGLGCQRGEFTLAAEPRRAMIERLQRPTPRIELGRRLIGLARSAIDLSDGLIGDLGHVLRRSGVAAKVEWDKVPRSAALRTLGESDQQRLALAGGDDYELLFSVPPGQHAEIESIGGHAGVAVSRIGRIEAGSGLTVVDRDGRAMDIEAQAFDHFRP